MPPALRRKSCPKYFASQSDLKKHHPDVHQDQSLSPSNRFRSSYRCLEGCELHYIKCAELRSHLKNVHNLSHEVEELRFATNEEYTSWLHSDQNNILGRYVLTKSITRTKTAEKMYLHCPHSDNLKSAQNTEDTQESVSDDQIKIEGSSLRSSACTSQILVSKNIKDDTYLVTYHKTHYGHTMIYVQTGTRKRASKLMQSASPDSQCSTSSESEQRTQHKEKSKSYGKNVKCEICKKEYCHDKSLYVHMRNIHKNEMIPRSIKNEPKFQCDHCNVTFVRKFDCRRHLRKFHTTIGHDYNRTSRKKTCQIICSYANCREEFFTYDQLRAHLCNIHDMEIEFEVINFDSTNEFEKWKTEMQQKTLSLYCKRSGTTKLNVKGVQKLYYYCHRSYTYIKKGENERAGKAIGSNKINKACPSRLEVTFTKSQVSVIFWKTHFGHTAEIARTYLDKRTRAWIAGLLSQGLSYDTIIDKVQTDLTEEDGCQRMHFTARQDLYNILRDFNIKKRHHDDAGSMQLWEDEMNAKDECPNSFQGENYNDKTDNILLENKLELAIEYETDNILLENKLELAIGLCKKNTFSSENMKTILKQADKLIKMLNEGSVNFETPLNAQIATNEYVKH